MVYSGKRSLACAECRSRKTKCDLRTPACGQCTRVGRSCSGPRDSTDIMFVHQTRKTVGKPSQPKQTKSLVVVDRTSFRSGHRTQQTRPQQEFLSPLGCILRLSVDDLGVNWFLRSRRENNSAFALQDKFFSRYHRQVEIADISESMKAVGLAGYAREAQQHALIPCAEKSYAKAVRVINEALSEPDVALNDRLLFSVMMLAMFEINTWPRVSGLQNLHNHVNGLLSLASLSAREGKPAELHRRLMALIVRFYAFQSWYFHRPLPAEFFTVKDVSLPEEHFQTKLLDLIIELIQFEDRLQIKTLDKLSILSECSRLDGALRTFCNQIPPSGQWAEYTVSSDFQDLAYQGVIHYYPVANAAPQRNILRYARIHLNLILANQCRQIIQHSDVDRKLAPIINVLRLAEDTVRQLAREICATVPQLADYLDSLPFQADQSNEHYIEVPRQSTTALVELSPFLIYNPGPVNIARSPPAADGMRPPKLDSLYHIYWHLLFLPRLSFLEVDMKEWIRGRLLWIEEHAEPEALDTLRAMKRRIERNVNMGLYYVTKENDTEDH